MPQGKTSSAWCLLAVVLAISITGCAGAYHDYSGCRIPYLYCAPPPLPYVGYDGCHCPTPVGSQYRQQRRGIPTDNVSGQASATSTPTLFPEGARG